MEIEPELAKETLPRPPVSAFSTATDPPSPVKSRYELPLASNYTVPVKSVGAMPVPKSMLAPPTLA